MFLSTSCALQHLDSAAPLLELDEVQGRVTLHRIVFEEETLI